MSTSKITELSSKEREQEALDSAVAQGGAYDILRKRLSEQGNKLQNKAEELNQQRLAEFGKSQMDVIGRVRIRSEHNCVARDIVHVGDLLLFGYNVFIGLKKETHIEDVFSLYRVFEHEDGYETEHISLENTFLSHPDFVRDFTELYTYYKNTQLLQLIVLDSKLLASFQIGDKVTDIRVFRWNIGNKQNDIQYIDNRGERDIALPSAYDFDWVKTDRQHRINGRHPHVNILDTVFVETVGGDLTVKLENNTETGQGIYNEPVQNKTQSLDDAQIEYAKAGNLILLKILPYREETWRYLVYNILTHSVQRIDALSQACIQLPEDHGIIFPGGYYLQNGEYKTFEQSMAGMHFRRSRRSPNGEDVLYVFYEPLSGRIALFNYNMIDRELQNPLLGHGYAVYEDGRMVIFEGQSDEPTRIHPMQIWQTPYYSDEHAAQQPASNSFLGRIGNAELVRGISDLYHLAHQTDIAKVSSRLYEALCQDARKVLDIYYWLNERQSLGINGLLRDIAQTSELVLDEYEKVESIRRQTERAMNGAIARQKQLASSLLMDSWTDTQQFVDALNAINSFRGQLITLRTYRYIDLQQVELMEQELNQHQERVSIATGEFLASEKALEPFNKKLEIVANKIPQATNTVHLNESIETMESMSHDLDMLSQLMTSLKFDDAAKQTTIVESISEVYARLNQSRARSQQRRKELSSTESIAQFGAQFKLFSQGIINALTLATDPERCDEQLSRLLIQLEELESQFSEHDEFLNDILAKREEVLETFESHKQSLNDERQRRAQSLQLAAERILESLPRRTSKFTTQDEMNAFFAGDTLAIKIREIVERLRDLNDNVKADDIDARFKAARDQSIRSLRDKSEIFEDGGNIIKLGPRHRFSVNTQELDLTILPRSDHLYLHLTGTDYLELLNNQQLESLKEFWPISLESESPNVYRAEYLAYSVIYAIGQKQLNITIETLYSQLTDPVALTRTVRDFAAQRYKEGYEKGIHDHDAVEILKRLLPLGKNADLLRFNPLARSIATLFWHYTMEDSKQSLWPDRARTCQDIARLFGDNSALLNLQLEIETEIALFLVDNPIKYEPYQLRQAAEFLAHTLSRPQISFSFSKYARQLHDGLRAHLAQAHMWRDFNHSQQNLADRLSQRWLLAENWFKGLSTLPVYQGLLTYIPEAIALTLMEKQNNITIRFSEIDLECDVTDLLGEHRLIKNRTLTIKLDEYFSRMRQHRKQFIPGYHDYQNLRYAILTEQRRDLRLNEFKPRPLTSFVRNKLINDIYLPIIGDNLAKQIGTIGENKRTDLMGLLLLISPPGYGKTTLIEYIAHRLGLIFMKINGPALGHNVFSLDPQQAPDATSRQELEKLNLAFEMGNNVMLYIDDIQHTNPEFLQKFISLCDGSRRIEGVWKNRSKTYDLRGKKFCVVMAGNPYTESGEVFKIPDMLANRADIYNLGDALGGMEETFSLSYIENCLTSNQVLAPLALRDMNDLYLFVDRAMGKPFNNNDLSYDYSEAEINEIVAILQRLLTLRRVILRVNQQYIASAAQADKYRIEPPFKLQGSYRNMNKLAEKISAVMNDDELNRLLEDHYQAESQLLTQGAEENLLKLAEMRDCLTPEKKQRWEQIKRDFLRNKSFGGEQADVGSRVVAQLSDLVESIQAFHKIRD